MHEAPISESVSHRRPSRARERAERRRVPSLSSVTSDYPLSVLCIHAEPERQVGRCRSLGRRADSSFQVMETLSSVGERDFR